MTAYYNENNPEAAAWLRELIKAGLIAPGHVDDRSIEDVQLADLDGFTQFHFFAGIGVWSYALRCAGWPDDRPVWTGSCPCQPFSQAGKGAAFDDPRHLWPTWFRLIRKCRPDTIFGEQVASKDGLAWLDALHVDLENSGYAVGAVDSCAAGFGAPHIRQRLYWVANAEGGGRREEQQDAGRRDAGNGEGETLLLARNSSHHRPLPTDGHWRDADWLLCRDGKWRPVIASFIALVDGLAIDMVHCCDYSSIKGQAEKEEINDASCTQGNTSEALFSLSQKNGEEKNQRQAGMLGCVYSSEVLRQEVHGCCDGQEGVFVKKSFQNKGAQNDKAGMRNMWEEYFAACSSQERGAFRQHPVELDDIVRELPQAYSLAELHGDRNTQDALLVLHERLVQKSNVQHTLEQTPSVWASLGEETKDRFRMGVDVRAWRRLVFFPLEDKAPARVGRLRGYGNAIVAPQAEAFVRAYMETIGLPTRRDPLPLLAMGALEVNG